MTGQGMMTTKNICPKCGTIADALSGSRFCLECGADLKVSDEELAAEEERKRKKIEEELRRAEERKKAEEERKRREAEEERERAEEERKRKKVEEELGKAEERRRKKNEEERKKAEEARKRREAEEERKRKEEEAKAQVAAEEERKRKEAESKAKTQTGSLKSKAEDVLDWVVGALIIFVIAYSLFNGVPGFNGVRLYDAPADMVDWVAWVAEEVTGTVPHKEGPVYRISKLVFYDFDGNRAYQYDYEYDRRGNVTKETYWHAGDDSAGIEESTKVCTYSDYDELGCYHTFKYEGEDPEEVAYDVVGTRVKKKTWKDSYVEYEYNADGTLSSTVYASTSDYIHRYEYFDNGFLHSDAFQGSAVANTETYEWKFDSDDNPKSYRCIYGTDEELAESTGGLKYTVFCNNEGNMTTIRGDNGKRHMEFEYVKILRPSVSAWTKAHVVNFDGSLVA